MIDKILDKYFAKKCLKEIENLILVYFNLDFKSIKTNYGYDLLVKKGKYKDYTFIGTIEYDNAANMFIHFSEHWDNIFKTIENYNSNKY